MIITNISEAKAQLSALIEKVLSGQEVIIGEAGKAVARVVSYAGHGSGKRGPAGLPGGAAAMRVSWQVTEIMIRRA